MHDVRLLRFFRAELELLDVQEVPLFVSLVVGRLESLLAQVAEVVVLVMRARAVIHHDFVLDSGQERRAVCVRSLLSCAQLLGRRKLAD